MNILDFVMVGSNDYKKSSEFYDAILEPLKLKKTVTTEYRCHFLLPLLCTTPYGLAIFTVFCIRRVRESNGATFKELLMKCYIITVDGEF